MTWKFSNAALGLALVLGLLGIVGCGGAPESLPPCDPAQAEAGRVICNLMNPEDLGLLPGRAWIVVSEMARMDPAVGAGALPERGGDLLAIRLSDGARRRLFPLPTEEASDAGSAKGIGHRGMDAEVWGDAACPGPPSPERFMPHGLDAGTDAGGRAVLAVVNHGGREAVELFEIDFRRGPALEWRGCVPMPEGMMMNDVALLRDGGFVVTNFTPTLEGMGLATLWTGFEIMTGRETGAVYRWMPGGEVVEIENSRGSAPNGIAVTPDGSEIFVAEWGADSLYRLRLDGEGAPRRDSVALGHSPDNLTWTRDGRLLVTGQAGGLPAILGCNEIEEGACDIGYGVYAIDPVSLEVSLRFEGVGAGSVALEVADETLVGSFVGDRLDRVPNAD
jgi:hypothetical protein